MTEENRLAKIPTDVFSLMDREDDKQIIAEIENRVVKKWCYEITDKKTGKVTLGPSKAGIDACVQLLAKKGEILRDEDLRWQELPNGEIGFVAIVAKYMVTPDGKEVKLDQAIGTKNQPLHFDKAKINENPHWFTTGGQKAVRNARRRLIPEAIITEMIRMAKEQSDARIERLEHDASNTIDGEVIEPTKGGTDRNQPTTSVRPSPPPPQDEPPTCDKCGKPMKRRSSAKGEFWGCSGYPKCRNIKNIHNEAPTQEVLPSEQLDKLQSDKDLINKARVDIQRMIIAIAESCSSSVGDILYEILKVTKVSEIADKDVIECQKLVKIEFDKLK